ncbi:MAG TPA: hypothetical protein VJB16_06665 [archaeon]|nr:hypothetical protein [archaeon]
MPYILMDARGTLPSVTIDRLPELRGQVGVCSGCSTVRVGDWYVSCASPAELTVRYGPDRLSHGFGSQTCQDAMLNQLAPPDRAALHAAPDYKALPPACAPHAHPVGRARPWRRPKSWPADASRAFLPAPC